MNNTSTKKKETNNFGPAAMTMKTSGKDVIEINCGFITGKDVENFELNLTAPVSYTCVVDGERAYRINEFGELIRGKVDPKKMKEISKQRKTQGRKVEEKSQEEIR